jgi:flavin-dependent dehydrogenase
MSISTEFFDVIVAGAGPAGSACATFLGRAGLRVLLVDRGISRPWQPAEILAPATVQLLRCHDLLEVAIDDRYGVCRGVYGLWQNDPAFVDYELLACDAGVAVNRRVFDDKLVELATTAGVRRLTDASLDRAVRDKGGAWVVTVTTANGPISIRASVIVDAGGRIGRDVSSPSSKRRYFDGLLAMACPIRLPRSRYQIMLLEADVQGWWYCTSDAEGDGAAVYLSDSDLIPRSPRDRDAFFRARFLASRLIRNKLFTLPDVLDLRIIDARTSRRTPFRTDASVAIGDAAYAVDPLSGGGIRRAVETALHASEAVEGFLAGDSGAFDRYDDWAESDFARCLSDKTGVYTNAAESLLGRSFWRRRVSPALSLPLFA